MSRIWSGIRHDVIGWLSLLVSVTDYRRKNMWQYMDLLSLFYTFSPLSYLLRTFELSSLLLSNIAFLVVIERGDDTKGGVWRPWPLWFEESHLAHPRFLCPQRWWSLWGLGLAVRYSEGTGSVRSPTLRRDLTGLSSSSAYKIFVLTLTILDQRRL
jgi:hypothetical protein